MGEKVSPFITTGIAAHRLLCKLKLGVCTLGGQKIHYGNFDKERT